LLYLCVHYLFGVLFQKLDFHFFGDATSAEASG